MYQKSQKLLFDISILSLIVTNLRHIFDSRQLNIILNCDPCNKAKMKSSL